MIPGETNAARKTIFFPIFTSDGLLASGGADPDYEGTLFTAAGATLEYEHNRDGYVAALGTFGHNGDGEFYYIFDDTEVAALLTEGTVAFRAAKPNFRTQVMRVPFEYPRVDVYRWLGVQPAALSGDLVQTDLSGVPSAAAIRDAILNAVRASHVTAGTVGEGLAIAASMLQGNFYMDTVVNGTNGQTSGRIRCFHTGVATAAATQGGSGEGEFATFVVTTTYSGPNKIVEHRAVQQ